MASHDWHDLHPAFQALAQSILAEANAKGANATFGDTFRTPTEQQIANPGLAMGWHNVGLAFDYACHDASGKYITDGEHPFYKIVGDCAVKRGCIWGGNWKDTPGHKGPDYDHIEWHPGFTLQQYLGWLALHHNPEA